MRLTIKYQIFLKQNYQYCQYCELSHFFLMFGIEKSELTLN